MNSGRDHENGYRLVTMRVQAPLVTTFEFLDLNFGRLLDKTKG